MGLLDDQNPEKPHSKSSKSRGRGSRSDGPDSGKSRRGNASRHKEKGQKSVSKSKAKERHSSEQDTYLVAEHLKSELEQDLPQRSAWVRCDDCHKWRCISATLADSIEETNCKWTCKDNLDKAFADCSVPQEKSNAEINRELEISDVSCDEDAYDTPLNYNGLEWRNSAVPQPSQWMLIKSNLFLHRHRKTQTIDEIMVCHCKPPQDGRMGCGDECLNRMLNIECVQGTCPCGDLCSNQQFQKRNYAKLKWFRCGKKGYGLQMLEDISQGQFLIEYVGEVLDLHTYQARQGDYASRGHKHFYFMTLNGSEIIDACAKGNLGRFINHSCDPNCRTEKWMVNGEVCIGLFALRDIKKDEEVTFDYNYVRVFGAAVKKCVCGSPHCRGYIGGDPHNAEVIVQGDSDEEYPEPIMIHEDDENIESIVDNNLMSSTVENRYPEISSKGDRMDEPVVANVPLKLPTENEESVCKPASTVSQLQNSLEIEDETRKLPAPIKPVELTLQKEDIRSNIESADQRISSEREIPSKSSDIQRFEGSLPCTTENSLCHSIVGNKKSVHNNVEEKPVLSKLLSIVKASRRSVKKAKAKNNHVSEKKCQTTHVKSQALSSKPKKLEISANGRVDGVEEKLNELLNAEGGISKRKDAAKGYLKLLFLTAASGDGGNGEAIQSTRDLSMILDALLKTKSRMVLVDIINKNGLQMLHNIMKQNRKDFNKIPVLRKLLKVLEYFAGREVLTLDHIIAGPPCPGMESFRESMLLLTEHSDKQVHQIARSFRDKWIPKHLRKIACMNRVDVTVEFQRGPNCNNFSSHKRWHDWGPRSSDAIDCVNNGTSSTTLPDSGVQDGTSAPYVSDCPSGRTKGQKRKSRWDQPAEINIRSSHCKELKMQHGLLQRHESGTRIEHDELVLDHMYQDEKNCSSSTQQNGFNVVGNGKEKSHEDVPPGFSIPVGNPLVLSNALSTSADLDTRHLEYPSDLVTGHPQRFDSDSPVFYGIPLGIMQQYGTGLAETAKSWVVAPGVPFQPFPPLPPYPRGRRHPPSNSAKLPSWNQSHAVQHDNLPPPHQTNRSCPSVSGAGPQDMVFTNGNGQPLLDRGRDSHPLGRQYFRQQKWNVPKVGPPWVRMRNNWGFVGNQSRNGICSVDMGNVADGLRGPPDGRSRRENGGNFFNQHSWAQN
ncbi:Zinc finger, CW-type [Dillenia turbinata]|uniref:Zinc finger, CW-type n=1 Tax=Dillenia turbinata TaxID=194707 RepID=A0AAN8VV70_9MAGN